MSMVKPLFVASIASLTLSITSTVQRLQQMLGPVEEHHKQGVLLL